MLCPICGFRSLSRGFTTLELVVVVAIVAILAAMAVPGFTPLMERWRVRQASEAMVSTLALARSEAVKRGGGIVVRRSAPCTSNGDWSCGWLLFYDVPGTAANESLRETEAFDGVTIQSTHGADDKPNRMEFSRWGELEGSGTREFVFSSARGVADAVAVVCLRPGGRIRTRHGVTTCAG